MPRRAIVLMNLGGPDSPAAIRPFLYNLFSDPAILRLPTPLRVPLAWLVAARRAPLARRIYQHLGGGSPLLANTQAQAHALAVLLGPETRCFVAMRYWHPLTEAVVRAVAAWRPDEILLLPLYPQFSTTTTESSLSAWRRAATALGLDIPTRSVRSYPAAPGFVEAVAALIRPRLDDVGGSTRLLFSAHGLPQRIVLAGDPYPEEVECTAAAVIAALGRLGCAGLDWRVCYQSRVGPLPWIGPSIDDEVRRAGQDGAALVVAPISFVSEHSETLVELDIEYRRLAEQCGVRDYRRVPTVGTDARFIGALAALVRESETSPAPGAAALAALGAEA
ncbi:MAG: ferrochelatase [Alphaproteobacteria bacterium]|nr:ferrochelatase [Alphaproteobacteria bacterium]